MSCICQYPADDVCSFCGSSRPTAVWRGSQKEVYCCPSCAANVLPPLAADAIKSTELPALNANLDRMMASFWRAFALRMIRGE